MTDLRRLFPLHCKPPLAHETHSHGKYHSAKYRPKSLRDVSFSSAVTFPSRRQIRRLYPMTRPPVCPSVCPLVCLRACPSSCQTVATRLRLLCAVSRRSRALNHSKLAAEFPSAPAGSPDERRHASVCLVPLLMLLSLSFFFFIFAFLVPVKKKAAVHSRTEAFCLVFFPPKRNQTFETLCKKKKGSLLHIVSGVLLLARQVRMK